jgi:hypothetical protein
MAETTVSCTRAPQEDDQRLDGSDDLNKKWQLELWAPRIKEAELKAAEVSGFCFNNHARSKSSRSAFLLIGALLG